MHISLENLDSRFILLVTKVSNTEWIRLNYKPYNVSTSLKQTIEVVSGMELPSNWDKH